MNPMLAYYAYGAHPIILILVILLIVGALPVYPYNRSWGYPPLILIVVILLLVFVTGCADMTAQQAKLLADVETTAVSVGVMAGNAYAQNGDVNTTQLIATGLQSTSSILADVLAIQASHVTPAATAQVTAQVNAQVQSKVVKTTVAPKVLKSANAAIAAGVPAKDVAKAASKGLNQAATTLVDTAKSNQ